MALPIFKDAFVIHFDAFFFVHIAEIALVDGSIGIKDGCCHTSSGLFVLLDKVLDFLADLVATDTRWQLCFLLG